MDDGCEEEKEVGSGGSLGKRSGGKWLIRGHVWLKCRVKGGGVEDDTLSSRSGTICGSKLSGKLDNVSVSQDHL